VVDNLHSTDKFAAIHEVVGRAGVFSDGPQRSVVERIQSTGIGHGVAAAHGQTDGVTEVTIALGISRLGIDYHAIDGQPVKLLFVLATPPDRHRDYLTALSGICRLSKREFFEELLARNMTEQELQQQICQAFQEEVARSSANRGAPPGDR
jgi:PTS system nitrogen regulatory IIA component